MRAIWASIAYPLSCSALKVTSQLTVLSIQGHDPTNAVNYPVFGLQDALDISYINDSRYDLEEHTADDTGKRITLFSNVCGNETQNCTSACLDSKQMFGNLETLHNCWLYPLISEQWAGGNLTVESVSFVKDLGFKKSSEDPSLPSNIFNAIKTCLLHTCPDNNPSCTKFFQANTKLNRPSWNSRDDSDICAGFPAPVVADVGGVGVYVSYAMQIAVALLASVIAIPWKPIVYTIYNMCRTCLDVLSTRYNSSIAKERFRQSLRKKNVYPEALTTALISFQKAQCFFMLATNIAGLVIQENGGLQPRSLQQFYNTYIFIKIVAISGFLPITFTLLTLHMIHKVSWYLLTLSLATIGVATATLIAKSGIFPPNSKDFQNIMDIASTGGPASCASNNLAAWCYNRYTISYFGFDPENADDGKAILAFCLVTTVILIIDHFCRSTDPTQRRLNHWILKKLHIPSEKPPFKYAKRVLDLGTAFFHLTFFCIYIYCFSIFAVDLAWLLSSDAYDTEWGFGQIVAILVFAPTLCDYCWEQARGVEKGSEHRLPNRLEVRPKVTADEGSTGGKASADGTEYAMLVLKQGN